MTDYVPYEAMAAQDANIKWPQFDDNNNPFVAPENSSDSNGAVLGYVSFNPTENDAHVSLK